MGSAKAQALVPHAWKAGEQTQRLRDMLYAMPQGGVVAMHAAVETPDRGVDHEFGQRKGPAGQLLGNLGGVILVDVSVAERVDELVGF